jgi:hypothetical protein
VSKNQWLLTDSVAGIVSAHDSPHEQWDAVRRAIGSPPAPRVEPWAVREVSQAGQQEVAA